MTPDPVGLRSSGASDAADRPTAPDAAWLQALRRYVLASAVGHVVWEFAHMPLYTLWVKGDARQITFAALHCTGGDLLIAAAVLLAALLVAGRSGWPAEAAGRPSGAAPWRH